MTSQTNKNQTKTQTPKPTKQKTTKQTNKEPQSVQCPLKKRNALPIMLLISSYFLLGMDSYQCLFHVSSEFLCNNL